MSGAPTSAGGQGLLYGIVTGSALLAALNQFSGDYTGGWSGPAHSAFRRGGSEKRSGPQPVEDREMCAFPGIGAVTDPARFACIGEVLRKADTAMYAAKAASRGEGRDRRSVVVY